MEQPPRFRLAWTLVSSALFFVLFYLYIWLVIDPRVLYEGDAGFPPFSMGRASLEAAVTHYGRLVEYVSGFLAQSYYLSWLGALVITTVTGLICVSLDVLVRAMGGSRVRFIALIPAVAILAAHNHYFVQVTLLVGLLLALGCAALYVRAPLERDLPRIAVFLVLSLIVYFAAGGVYLLFALVTGAYELLARQRRLPALIAFLSMEAIPYFLGGRLFALDLIDAFAYLLPYHPDTSRWGREAVVWAYVLPPVLLVAVGIWRIIGGRRRAREDAPEVRLGETAEGAGKSRLLKRLADAQPHPAVGWVLCLVLTATAVFLTYDDQNMARARIDYYARCRMWSKILSTAQNVRPDRYDPLVAQHVNEALYHTGRLPHEMFRYPQQPDWLQLDMELRPSLAAQSRRRMLVNGLYFQVGDLDLQLGLVNEAEREAHEALAVHGEHGQILYRLALINIIKEQSEAARVFLRALTRHWAYRRQAESLLERLEVDPSLSSDPTVKHVRAAMLLEDEAGFDVSGEWDYRALLNRNKHNRMAFEYLMAYYLLTGQLEELAENLPRLRDFGYPDMPRHYQEAILIYEDVTGKRADHCGYEISDQVRQQFTQLPKDMELGATDEAAADSVVRRYGNTYLFYFTTGLSGLGNP